MKEQLWSIEEIALWANVSLSTVRRWILGGKLVGQKVGRQWRFDPTMVRNAFDQGLLSGVSNSLTNSTSQHSELPSWAKSTIERWGRFIEDQLQNLRPDHLVVNDRRGAKIWELMTLNHYTWGKNLWHSTAVRLMTPKELRQTFGRQRVFLFDEMMQHGRQMNELRQNLESKDVNAVVDSLVCIRRKAHAESGELLEYKALYCEDLDDPQFVERAALISRLANLFEPPLDVDHLVIKGTFNKGLKTEDFLERIAKWGIPFIVWFNDEDHNIMSITLDRPQFFQTKRSFPDNFTFGWNGPCKIRFYGIPEKGPCYCSFIVYPDIEAPDSEWNHFKDVNNSGLIHRDTGQGIIRAYSALCINLAVDLLNDFVKSGAIEDIGIKFDKIQEAFDLRQLQATYGPSLAAQIAKRVGQIFANDIHNMTIFKQVAQKPVPLHIRKDVITYENNNDTFKCHVELLKKIPQAYSPNGNNLKPISWQDLLCQHPEFSEPTIGRVLDNELDKGTVKPVNWIERFSKNGIHVTKVWRGFCRGEFGPWFEWNRQVVSHESIVMQRTIGLGPTVIEKFSKQINKTSITGSEFDKIFTNLQHDLLEDTHDLFYLGWRPYKYGPVPVVPVASPSGEFKEFQRFLIEVNCIKEIKEPRGSLIWNKYEPEDDEEVPWRVLYKQRVNSITRAHVTGLVRLYAAIQNECKVKKFSMSGSTTKLIFPYPLVALATVRNVRIAYICGWFEVHDWKAKGDLLFSLLNSIAIVSKRPAKPFLDRHIENFASPARLLYEKIEMYRDFPYLYHQIEELVNRGDFDTGEILLENIDPNPKFESQSEYPMQNLEWASKIMRSFSSFTRQVLTVCGHDIDNRKRPKKGGDNIVQRDAFFYLNELLSICPELRLFENELHTCITISNDGYLTSDISKCLNQTFQFILNLFDSHQGIPDPRPQNERNREKKHARADLITAFVGIQFPQPYAIAVADIKNLKNIPKISHILKLSLDTATRNLLDYINEVSIDVVKHYEKCQYAGLSGDSVIFAGSNVEDVLSMMKELINETTQLLGQIDYNQIATFGLLRAGIAWREDNFGNEFQGARPGLIAHELANQSGQALGTINITKSVIDKLSPEHQSKFTEIEQTSIPEKAYYRLWDPYKDFMASNLLHPDNLKRR